MLVLGRDARHTRHQLVPLRLLAHFLLHLLDRLVFVSEASIHIALLDLRLAPSVRSLRLDVAAKRLVLLDVVGVLGLVVAGPSVLEHFFSQVHTFTHSSGQG